ncbi:ArsR family transcriptional regulator [Streptomyces triticagri]|uniref:ArsR family transcriptional regulator n=1 Tax=Streptomyces triticagri TaxID=2293568 RepID=A0A372M9M5_9ACTN|nr:helix-turn-helix domain-containing protein [Streptomyces triticagri]RFU86987.1 ArsR family transcriptional regulator [Streptomyces triticagri]
MTSHRNDAGRTEAHLSDPRALRAYAHPTRMTLVGLLRTEGPFTATRAAELTGESVASCSYHLRMLAKYGLVEQAGGGQGREKPWRATAAYTVWPDSSDDADVAAASAALSTAVAEHYFERVMQAIETRHTLPRAWQEAEQFGDSLVYLTADELTELREQMWELLSRFEARNADPALRPEGARLVEVLRIAFASRRVPGGAAPSDDAGDRA